MHLTEDQLNQMLDGELDRHTEATARQHLAACARCRAELDALRRLFAELDALPVPDFAIDLAPAVIKSTGATPQRWQTGIWVLLAAQIAVTGWLLALRWPLLALPALPTPTAAVGALLRWLDGAFSAVAAAGSLLASVLAAPLPALQHVASAEWLAAVCLGALLCLFANRLLLRQQKGLS